MAVKTVSKKSQPYKRPAKTGERRKSSSETRYQERLKWNSSLVTRTVVFNPGFNDTLSAEFETGDDGVPVPFKIHHDDRSLPDQDFWTGKGVRQSRLKPVTVTLDPDKAHGTAHVLFVTLLPKPYDIEFKFADADQGENDIRHNDCNFFRIAAHPNRLTTLARLMLHNKRAKFGSFSVFNFFPQPLSKVAESLQKRYVKACHKRLRAFIKKTKPRAVILSDPEMFRHFWPAYNPQTNSLFSPAKFIGQAMTHSYYGDKVFVPSLPLYDVTSFDYGKDTQDVVSLMGFVSRHVETAFARRNLYQVDTSDVKNVTVDTIARFRKFMVKLRKCKTPAMDCESANLNRISNTLLTMQFALSDKRAFIIPIDHPQSPFSPDELLEVKAELKDYFENGTSDYMVFTNAKFDVTRCVSQLGVQHFNHKTYDIVAGEFALDENRKILVNVFRGFGKVTPFSLEFIGYQYGSDVFEGEGKGKEDRANMASWELKDIADYGWKDVILPFQIANLQQERAAAEKDRHFVRTVTQLISDMALVFVEMEFNGTLVDHEYLMFMRSRDSAFVKETEAVSAALQESPAAKKANRLYLKRKGIESRTSMFGKEPWRMNLASPVCKAILFFDVLKLWGNTEPEYDSDGHVTNYPSCDSDFQEAYRYTVPEVDLLFRFSKISKLKGTFLDGTAKTLAKDPDARDGCIRCTYEYRTVVTGRISSAKPNLQQIPEHGELAPAIKRQFIAAFGYVFAGEDFSAQEVRGWGNAGNDNALGDNFAKGMEIRQKIKLQVLVDEALLFEAKAFIDKVKDNWALKKDKSNKDIIWDYDTKVAYIHRKMPKQKNKPLNLLLRLLVDLDAKGDVHRLNYQFFYGVPAESVNAEQRQSVKAVVFGVMYGKGAKSLTVDLKLDPDNDNDVETADDLINKLFTMFKGGGDWIINTIKKARETLVAVSPVGRVRHLWAYLSSKYSFQSAMDRRGPNSAIQGFASDIGFISAKLALDILWKFFRKKNTPLSVKIRNIVHDALYYTVLLEELPIAMYLLTHCMTTLTERKMKSTYGVTSLVGLETDFKFGAHWGGMHKVDNTWTSLKAQLIAVMDEQEKMFHREHTPERRKVILKTAHTNFKAVKALWSKELRKSIAEKDFNPTYMAFLDDHKGNIKNAGFVLAANDSTPAKKTKRAA